MPLDSFRHLKSHIPCCNSWEMIISTLKAFFSNFKILRNCRNFENSMDLCHFFSKTSVYIFTYNGLQLANLVQMAVENKI